ncbi:MAG: hypothetical protein ACOVT5_06115 [Armatimonadaceae bacterium]|jgi:hypothetical protein
MTSPPPPAPSMPPWRPLFFRWLVASFVAGGIGGGVSVAFGIPAYVGGLFAWMLTGMIGTFALAAKIAGR